MPPFYVKAYLKRQKNDAADAEAICKAVTRANMRIHAVRGGGMGDPHPVLFAGEGERLEIIHRAHKQTSIRQWCSKSG